MQPKGQLNENGEYNVEWFKERAFASLKRINNNEWDYSDSLTVYVPQGVKAYKKLQDNTTDYIFLITTPESRYIEKIASAVVKELPDKFNYIDLGPGTEHKEKYFFDAALSQHKTFTYFPVDVSEKILTNSLAFATANNIESVPILSSFEECALLLPSDAPRFVSLGLTFPNFETTEIFSLLNKIMGSHGYGFIDVQIREKSDMKAVTAAYSSKHWFAFMDPKIKLLGLDQERDISMKETTDDIKIWYTVATPSESLKNIGVKEGDKLLVFQSLRYTQPEITNIVNERFPNSKIFDTGDPFLGILLKN